MYFKNKEMKTRTDLLNHLVAKHNLKRYLEIGVQNPSQNFNKIQCEYKVSVDPNPNAQAQYILTSDKFFELIYRDEEFLIEHKEQNGFYDLIFIDGLHTSEQVEKDFQNALKILSPNGFIVLHDCNPEKEEHTIVPRPTVTGHWNGDIYKFACKLSINKSFCTVDVDNGCGIYRKIGRAHV